MSNDPLRIFEPGFSDDTMAQYQQQARAVIDAWRDEWHLEPEPEMDGASSQVYESLVNYVAAALAAPTSTVAPQQSDRKRESLLSSEIAWKIARHIAGKNSDYFSMREGLAELESIINLHFVAVAASPAALGDEAEAEQLSGSADSERLGSQEDKPVKSHDDFRAGMLRAAEMARNEFKRAPEAAKGHDCVYMGGYEDACDHLSVVIAQAAVIDSVRIAGRQPDWQYHISLLFPDGIEDETLLKIFQVVEHELRAATTPPSTLARKAAEEIAANYEVHKDHCHSNERYPLPPCDCGAIEEIAAIIERCSPLRVTNDLL